MKTSKYWLSALAAVVGCAASLPCYGQGPTQAYQDQPVFRPALVEQQVPTSRWDAQEPVETPQQDATLAPVAPGTCVCAESCDFGLQLIAGAEATFLWPQLSRTFLETSFVNDLGPVSFINDTALGSADGSLFVGPRVTLGLQGDCWGLVGRYWNSATFGNRFFPAIPDSIDSGVILFDTFRAYTLDLEVQRRFCWRNWDSFGFFGVRYASVDNDRVLSVQNTFGFADVVQSRAFAGQQFNGTGITFGVTGLRPLFCDGGALKAYVRNRYSIVWGNGLALTETSAAARDANFTAEDTTGALAIGDGGMFIVEVGFGLQWESCLKCLPGRAFLRTGLEWQYWDANANVFAGSVSNAALPSGLAASAFTQTGDLLFDLVGFTLGAGITY